MPAMAIIGMLVHNIDAGMARSYTGKTRVPEVRGIRGQR
jgi:hypothetical protein